MLTNKSAVWDFVEKYYPNYSSSDEIAFNNDLQKLLERDITSRAEELYNDIYINREYKIEQDFHSSLKNIYEKSIKAYLESL